MKQYRSSQAIGQKGEDMTILDSLRLATILLESVLTKIMRLDSIEYSLVLTSSMKLSKKKLNSVNNSSFRMNFGELTKV